MRRPNIVLISIDSLRADHLGCYGYAKNTSPQLDAVAAEGVLFERSFAAGIPTMPSFTTLLSGRHPYSHGITAHASEQRLNEEVVLLPQMLQDAGYATIGIDNLVVQGNGRGSWFARGFDFYSGYLYKPFSDQSTQLVDRATKFIDEVGKANPFFLWLHLWDPHTPYGPPEPFDKQHYDPRDNEGAPDLADVKAIAPEYYEAFLGDMNLKVPDDYAYVVAQYDGEISYVDSQVGRLVGYLKAQNLWDETIFVVMSDHGECFGEGEVYFDHHGLYDAVTRTVLIWRDPQGVRGRSRAIVTTNDIAPTILQACGANELYELHFGDMRAGTAAEMDLEGRPEDLQNEALMEAECRGRSFLPALRGGEFHGRDFVVSCESTRQASICLRTDKWKLIEPVTHLSSGEMLPDIYGRPRPAAPVLFDLENDPAETTDMSAEHPEVLRALQAQLHDWRARQVARRGGDDPLLENGLSLDFNDFMARLTTRRLRG